MMWAGHLALLHTAAHKDIMSPCCWPSGATMLDDRSSLCAPRQLSTGPSTQTNN